MWKRIRVAPAIVWLVMFALVSLILPTFSTVPTVEAQAGTEAHHNQQTGELYYDDGIAVKYAESIGGCPACHVFQGVLFELPEGLPSATVTGIRLYLGGGAGLVTVYVTDAAFQDLCAPVQIRVSNSTWYTVSIPQTQVRDRFWVSVNTAEKGATTGYDAVNSGHSYYGPRPVDYHFYGKAPGDWLIRPIIRPEVYVGSCPQATFGAIQEAVDAVGAGTTILVCEGAYDENVTIDKSITIRSLSGATKTTVQASSPDEDVFSVTADHVSISGFTIQGAPGSSRAGVNISGASNCVISSNVIQDNVNGIYVSDGSTNNVLLENECLSNSVGIFIDGDQNPICGNKIHGNSAGNGSAVFLSGTASGNQLRFNSITIDPGTDDALAASYQVYNANSAEQASAIENWWGDATGPANAGGTGAVIGPMVLYEPWLNQIPLRVTATVTATGDATVNARSATFTVVLKSGTGTPTVSTARFAENPAGEFPRTSIGRWVDVLFSGTDGAGQTEIRMYYTANEIAGVKEGSLRLYWWNGEKWKVCSKSGVDKANDFVWARVNLSTKPSTNDLGGTLFAVGTAPTGGFQWWLIPLIIVILLILLIAFRLFWVLAVKRVEV